ncbi:MAG: succinyl-CoA synthetase beta subunit [Bacillota bacterium]|nr:MAG: succinyl-CoA synthetase beta subunit [Bacillota bacterium]
MKLFEFQGKRLFKEFGIAVPEGTVFTASQPLLESMAAPKVLKAQVLAGGRGKSGGIKVVRSGVIDQEALNGLFTQIIEDEPVQAVLIEDMANILQEFYLSMTFLGSLATPVLIACPAGGMDIEEVAHNTPEKILRIHLNPLTGPSDYQVRTIAKEFGLKSSKELAHIINQLWKMFRHYEASLVEINPLALTSDGLMALDAKVVLDEKAAFRHTAAYNALLAEQEDILQTGEEVSSTKGDTITYVPLDGTVGLISDGAGTGMLTLDLIKDSGGNAANFCEMGGLTSPEVMYKAMEIVMANLDIKSLLVVLIGGFNRMDDMAEGIIRYRQDHGMRVPMVVRMCGTMEEVGKEMMRQADIPTYEDLIEAVRNAVSLAGGNA